jgi:hypothetical protein
MWPQLRLQPERSANSNWVIMGEILVEKQFADALEHVERQDSHYRERLFSQRGKHIEYEMRRARQHEDRIFSTLASAAKHGELQTLGAGGVKDALEWKVKRTQTAAYIDCCMQESWMRLGNIFYDLQVDERALSTPESSSFDGKVAVPKQLNWRLDDIQSSDSLRCRMVSDVSFFSARKTPPGGVEDDIDANLEARSEGEGLDAGDLRESSGDLIFEESHRQLTELLMKKEGETDDLHESVENANDDEGGDTDTDPFLLEKQTSSNFNVIGDDAHEDGEFSASKDNLLSASLATEGATNMNTSVSPIAAAKGGEDDQLLPISMEEQAGMLKFLDAGQDPKVSNDVSSVIGDSIGTTENLRNDAVDGQVVGTSQPLVTTPAKIGQKIRSKIRQAT